MFLMYGVCINSAMIRFRFVRKTVKHGTTNISIHVPTYIIGIEPNQRNSGKAQITIC